MKFSEFINKQNAKNEATENVQNYMFFGNLETIKRHAEMLLALNPQQVDEILKNGHDWAEDHITTCKDDIEEVCNFFQNETKEKGTGVMPKSNESVNEAQSTDITKLSDEILLAMIDAMNASMKFPEAMKNSANQEFLMSLVKEKGKRKL